MIWGLLINLLREPQSSVFLPLRTAKMTPFTSHNPMTIIRAMIWRTRLRNLFQSSLPNASFVLPINDPKAAHYLSGLAFSSTVSCGHSGREEVIQTDSAERFLTDLHNLYGQSIRRILQRFLCILPVYRGQAASALKAASSAFRSSFIFARMGAQFRGVSTSQQLY